MFRFMVFLCFFCGCNFLLMMSMLVKNQRSLYTTITMMWLGQVRVFFVGSSWLLGLLSARCLTQLFPGYSKNSNLKMTTVWIPDYSLCKDSCIPVYASRNACSRWSCISVDRGLWGDHRPRCVFMALAETVVSKELLQVSRKILD